MSDIGTVLVSKLGSTSSIIPLGVKDTFNTLGYTYHSYNAGGSIEGKDRLMDEVGTALIWLGGLPLYKKIVDKTLYKIFKISPDIDVRVAKDSSYIKKAIENAPNLKIKQELKFAKNNLAKTKALAISKFGFAMGMTMLSYLGLTKLKQNMTKLNIEKEFNKRMNMDSVNIQKNKSSEKDVFSDLKNFGSKHKEKNNPSFGSSNTKRALEEFMLSPVKNMMMLDGVITGQRLINSRTEGEFKEYAIKEGSFWVFVYFADKIIRNGLENLSLKLFNMPISLDAKFLSSDMSKKIIQDKKMQNEVKEFNKKFENNTNGLHEFIFKNQDNAVIKAAKKAGIIKTVKDAQEKADTRKYIDPDDMLEFGKNLEEYIKKGKNSANINNFVNKVRALKIGATILSIGASCLSLGYLVPKYMYEYREKTQDGNNAFHVITAYEEELAQRAKKTV